MKKFISLCLSLMMLLSVTAGLDLSAYAADDFTEIRTVSDLYRIRYDLDGNYILMNDIDLTAATSENGEWSYNKQGWRPICTTDGNDIITEGFTGVFDGNGYTISGLNLSSVGTKDSSNRTYPVSGLFATSSGTIKNLTMSNFDFSFKNGYHAPLVAINSGNIINCKSIDGTIDAKANIGSNENASYTGGICAVNNGTMKYCYSNCSLTATAYSHYVSGQGYSVYAYYYQGGISGSNSGSIICSYSQSELLTVVPQSGYSIDGGRGGITGRGGNIQNCYSFERISGNGGAISTSYCRKGTPGGTATDCYYLSGQGSQAGCTPLTEEQMKMDFMYQGFDFDNVWYIDEDSDYPYPQLRIPNTKTVEKITIKKQPKKTVYVTNEAIEAADGVLNVKYIDGTFEDVPMKDDMLSGYDIATAGTQTVIVTYEDKTATFDILVKDETNIDSLVIQSQPNKTTFVKGTKFDFTGCVARITYSDTTYDDIDITADMTSGGDINTVGTQTISYSVGGKTATFDVEVVPVVMDRIVVTSAPDKVDYLPDEELDTTGLVVKAEYNNGKIKEITNYTLSGFGDTNEVNPITVSYDEKETTFNVTIHTPDEEWTTITEANCTVQGEKVKYCKTCGNVVIRNVVDPKGHTPVTDDAVAATCTKIGLTEGSHCSVCGAVLTAQQVVNAKGHSYTSKTLTAASCTQKGIKSYTCSTCGDTYTTELEMTAHTIVDDNAVAATCTNAGLTAGRHCSVCGYVIAAQEVVNAKGHTYTSVVTTPTCKDQGYTTYTCTNCGESYKADFTAVTDNHDYKSIVTIPATCTAKGVKTYTCSICGDNYTEDIPATNNHTYTEIVVTPASCTTTGLKEYTCTLCGDKYTEVISKAAHTPEIEAAVEPKCETTGLTEGSRCSVCGAVLVEQQVLKKTGHTFVENVSDDGKIKTITCSNINGVHPEERTKTLPSSTYPESAHNYANNTSVTYPFTYVGAKKLAITFSSSTKTQASYDYIYIYNSAGTQIGKYSGTTLANQTITISGDSFSIKLTSNASTVYYGFSLSSIVATYDEEVGTQCDYCQEIELEHDYKEVVTTPATCTTKGLKTFTCSYCGDKYTEDIDMLEHTPVTDAAVAPTCTKSGLAEGSHCSICGTTLVEQDVVKAKGHTYTSVVTAPTCKEQGYTTYTCSVCGDSYKGDFTAVTTNHDYKSTVTTPATCTAKGVKTFTCSVCGDKYTEDIDMLAHTAVTDKAVAATCTKSGLTEGSHCSVCGTVIVEQTVIPANQHQYTPVVTAPTCRDKGYTTYTCSVCGDSYRADYTEKTNDHDYNGVVTKLPTCTAKGIKTFTCSVCGDTYTEPVEKLAHTPAEAVKENEKAATCTATGSYDSVVYCSECHTELSREPKTIDLIAHTPATDEAVAPTGTSTGLTEGSHCSVCGEILVAQEIVPALIPEGASVAVSGDKAVITLSDGSTITVPKDTKETVKNADGTYTVTLNDGSSVTVSSNTEITKTANGQLNIKATDNGKTTTVTVPSGSSVVKNGDNYKIIVVNGTETVEKTVAAGETVVIDKSGSMSCNGNHKYDKGVVTIAPSYVADGVKTYTCTVCGNQKIEKLVKLPKKANTLTVKAKKPTVKLAKLKKKNQVIALKKTMTVSKAKGTVTYKLSSAKKGKKNFKKYFKVAKNGKITVKKGLKKGTYTVKIKVTAAGNTEYNAAVKTVTVKIKVK